MFQFHNGTINTRRMELASFSLKCFNSTTVQLIPFEKSLDEDDKYCFNSTTVQLIPVSGSSETNI